MNIVKALSKVSGQNMVFPFYHAVSDVPLPHVKHLHYVKSEKEFRSDLEFLLRSYQPIDAHTLFQLNNEKKKPKKPSFHLTFDDGLKEIYEVVVPILLQKGIPATFFVNSAFVDNRDLFYRYQASLILEKTSLAKKLTPEFQQQILSVSYNERKKLNEYLSKEEVSHYLTTQQPYLTTQQICYIAEKGFTFGAHSINHPLYYKIAIEEQIQQTLQSLAFVEQIVKQDLRMFAFPFTDYGVQKLFFEKIQPNVGLTFGTAGIKKDSIAFNLQRVAAEEKKQNKELSKILRREYIEYIVKCSIGKESVQRR